MTANPTEVMTEEEQKVLNGIYEHAASGRDERDWAISDKNYLLGLVKRLCSEIVSLRSSRDEYQTALELKHKWMVDADATIERLDNTARLMMEGRDKARADLSAARAEVSRLSGELASRPAKELVEAATMAADFQDDAITQPEYLTKYGEERMSARAVVKRLRSALSQASSADALSAPAKGEVVPTNVVQRLVNDLAEACYGFSRMCHNNPERMEAYRIAGDNIKGCLTDGAGWQLDIQKYTKPDAFSPAPVAGETNTDSITGNWSEDFSHENGNYENKCCECGRMFIGHKRRVVCKRCVTEKEKLASAPASAISHASEEKDAKGEVVVWIARGHIGAMSGWVEGLPEGPLYMEFGNKVFPVTGDGVKWKAACARNHPDALKSSKLEDGAPRNAFLNIFWPLYEKWKAEQVSPTPAPAPSEEYPGVRVWKGVCRGHYIGLGKRQWFLCDDLQERNMNHCWGKGGEPTGANKEDELHGPERLAVIEKARKIAPNLFGSP